MADGITYDPAKSEINRQKHGLGLEEFQGFDNGVSVTVPDDRKNYGEARYRSFGRIDGIGYMIAFTPRDEGIHLISFRRARDKEIRRHEHARKIR